MAGRRLGQHFLKGAAWRARILERLRPAADQTWVEIGAGHGEMTRELAARAQRVMAIELDPPLVERLRALARECGNVEVVPADVLAVDFTHITGSEPVHVFGSLPYYITSPILRHLFAHARVIARIHVIVQLEVAARLVARPGGRERGFLSAMTQYFAEPEIPLRIPPGAFRPPPKVASALVRLNIPGAKAALGMSDDGRFLDFVSACFAQKRKTLANNLRGRFGAERTAALIAEVGLRPDARAEQLSLAEFARLYSALQ